MPKQQLNIFRVVLAAKSKHVVALSSYNRKHSGQRGCQCGCLGPPHQSDIVFGCLGAQGIAQLQNLPCVSHACEDVEPSSPEIACQGATARDGEGMRESKPALAKTSSSEPEDAHTQPAIFRHECSYQQDLCKTHPCTPSLGIMPPAVNCLCDAFSCITKSNQHKC